MQNQFYKTPTANTSPYLLKKEDNPAYPDMANSPPVTSWKDGGGGSWEITHCRETELVPWEARNSKGKGAPKR